MASGLRLLPAMPVSDALASGALCRIRWAGSDQVHRQVMLVLRRNRAPDLPAATALHDLLRRIPEMIPGAKATH